VKKHNLTAAEFIERLANGESDFRSLGKMKVIGKVRLLKTVVTTEVHLGELHFLNTFDCQFATFKEKFCFNKAIFEEGFTCRKAQFLEALYFDYAQFNVEFTFGEGRFYGPVRCAHATFFDVYCAYAIFKMKFYFDNAEIKNTFWSVKAKFKEGIDAGEAKFLDNFDGGEAELEGPFSCNKADFGTFYCRSIICLAGFFCDEAKFTIVHANKSPHVAWVIMNYKESGMHFELDHAPSRLQPKSTRLLVHKED